METIRNRLIHHGASVEVLPGVVRIRLNKSFPYQKEVLDILNELRQKVQIEEVGSIISGRARRGQVKIAPLPFCPLASSRSITH